MNALNARFRPKRAAPRRTPKELDSPGRALWKALQTEYDVDDAGGQALLLAACRAEDDIQRMRQTVAREGDVLKSDPSKPHPLLAAIRGSEQVRRQSISSLHLDLNPLENRPGRPSGR
jgi:hypothetical protein